MPDVILDYNQMPDEAVNTNRFQGGECKLTIKDLQPVESKTGGAMAQFSYYVNDTEFCINYDNCVLQSLNKSTGKLETCNYGNAKLKAILKAIGVKPEGAFTIKILRPLVIGKSFKAVAVKKEGEKYFTLDSDLKTIQPLGVTPNVAEVDSPIFKQASEVIAEPTLAEQPDQRKW